MSAETDPLLALRSAIKSRASITYADDAGPCTSLAAATHLVLNDHPFPKSISTRYRKAGAPADTKVRSDFYTLDALYAAWLFRDAVVADYMKQAREHGVTVFVSVTERKNVVGWLEGETERSDRITPLKSGSTTTPPGTPPRTTSGHAATTSRSRAAETQTSSPSKRKAVVVVTPDVNDAARVKRIKEEEVELKNHISVLRGTKPNNFTAVRTMYGEKLKKLKESSRAGAAPASSTPAIDPKIMARKARHNQPIIIISSSPTALITMHNVKRFLEDSSFEPSQDARARATSEGNLRPEDLIPIYRKRTTIDSSGKETVTRSTYIVVDSVEALAKLGTDAWERVVCVMTTGQAWQFRPYKWSEPRQLFHNVKGIYVSWSNDPPNTKIKDWNVTELKIDPHRRHVDKSVVAHFWKMLDTWITTNKPFLIKA